MGDILPQKSGRDFFGVIYAAKHYLNINFGWQRPEKSNRLPIICP
jgi:hypothetical protein